MKTGVKSTAAKSFRRGEVRPFVKWVGGKGRLMPQLAKYFPEKYASYYEPFVGGGAVFFSVNPKVGYINDANGVLMHAYRHIRDNLDKVIIELEVVQKTYWALPDLETKKRFYLQMRTEFNSTDVAELHKTTLLVLLNKTCFNGMYRENSKGMFNVPFGQHSKPTICDIANLADVSKVLQKAIISCVPYEFALTSAKAGDFVYMDPPYHPLNATSSFTSYQAAGFGSKDQEKLRDMYKALSLRGCKVMLSNSETPFIKELYKDFNIHGIFASRSINAIGSKRGKIAEIVVTNY